MSLSNELISQFVNATKEKRDTPKETTVSGTTVVVDGQTYVRFDGSDLLTPVTTTVTPRDNERVIVSIKNHTATITGNVSAPAARHDDVEGLGDTVTAMDIVVANKVSTENFDTENASIRGELHAAEAKIETLTTNDVDIRSQLSAVNAEVGKLSTDKLDATAAALLYATVGDLEATNADVRNLDADFGEFEDLTAGNFKAVNADIGKLSTDKLDAKTAEVTYANIDFTNIGKAAMEYLFSQSGLIQNVVIGEGTITGDLVGVTISGDLIEGNTVKAEKLVIKGSDGLYYKLNTDGMTTEAEQTDQNSLNGSIIKAKSITATKIAVEDLVAFDATIGGFRITDKALHSGVKDSATNTTQGIYLDSEGQMAVGDNNNFIRYFKDSNGNYKLEISSVDNVRVGGRNLLRNSNSIRVNSAADGITYSITEEGYLQIVAESGNSNWLSVILGSGYAYVEEELSEGDEYVISFTMRSPDSTYLPSVYLKSSMGYCDLQGTLSTQWSTAWYAGVWKDSADMIPHLGFSNRVGTYEIKNCKIERGNKATDWTPAPEDMVTVSQLAATETKITQNSEAITLRATKVEMNEAINDIEIGGRNLIPTSAFRTARNVVSTKEFELGNSWATPYIDNETLVSLLEPATEYTVSYSIELIERTSVPTVFDMMVGFLIYSGSAGTWISLSTNMSDTAEVGTVQHVRRTFTTPNTWTDESLIGYSRRWTTSGSSPVGFDVFTVRNFKIEKGNKATDWTPAPEDMSTAYETEEAQATADAAMSRVTVAESLIEALSESISMMVTDSNGTSLMTQTENGWTFSTAELQALVDRTSEGLNDLTHEVGDVNNTVGILQQAVSDLGAIAEYVKIGTYEDEPCIELGEGDSDFKLLITNTRIMFREGTGVPAYFTNQSMHIKKAVVEEELQQGGFVWQARANGNLGLVWKGVTS